MAASKPKSFMDDYVEVKDRIAAFYAAFPEGAIRTHIYDYREDVVIVGAEVFRTLGDESPAGTGFSQLRIPGATSFTEGSELENAETSAVGRAIAMAGFEVKRSIASADEIRSKISDASETKEAVDPEATELRKKIRKTGEALYGSEWKAEVKTATGITVTAKDTVEELRAAHEQLTAITIGDVPEGEKYEVPF